jgi:hypothetical protein
VDEENDRRVSGRELHKYPPLIVSATSGVSDVHLHDTFTAPSFGKNFNNVETNSNNNIEIITIVIIIIVVVVVLCD